MRELTKYAGSSEHEIINDNDNEPLAITLYRVIGLLFIWYLGYPAMRKHSG